MTPTLAAYQPEPESRALQSFDARLTGSRILALLVADCNFFNVAQEGSAQCLRRYGLVEEIIHPCASFFCESYSRSGMR